MITRKVNRSSQLIFLGPNYLKLSDPKPLMKKSMHFASPKHSTKPSIKTIYKPQTSSKKQPKHCNQQLHDLKQSIKSISPTPTINSKIKYASSSKRSKSKLTIHEHVSSEMWRSSVYQSQKQVNKSYRTPQSMLPIMSQQKFPFKQQQFEKILNKANRVLRKYCHEIRSLKQQVNSLQQQNKCLKKKLNCM